MFVCNIFNYFGRALYVKKATTISVSILTATVRQVPRQEQDY